MRKILLASSSPYRKQLLQQLGLPFVSATPPYFEEIDQDLAPGVLVKFLAGQKAKSLEKHFPDHLIIGSDQVFVDPRKRILGKPGSAEDAVAQLKAMAGRTHTFYTGLCVLDSATGEYLSAVETYTVTMRKLTEAQIRRYVEIENPIDCAGSFKIEGLGISLMEKMEGEDYNTLIGLPLIRLVDLLGRFGVDPLGG